MSRILILLLASALIAHPQGTSSRQTDAYAVYSTLLTTQSEAASNPTLAIAAQTRPAIGRPSKAAAPCIEPPAQYEKRWSEVLADFSTRIETPVALVRDLSIAKPYIYITAEEVAAFQASLRLVGLPLRNPAPPTAPPPPLDPKFQGLTHIFFLSDVYFSNDRTLALTGIANYCGGLCSSGQWKIFEKDAAGRWFGVQPQKDCIVQA